MCVCVYIYVHTYMYMDGCLCVLVDIQSKDFIFSILAAICRWGGSLCELLVCGLGATIDRELCLCESTDFSVKTQNGSRGGKHQGMLVSQKSVRREIKAEKSLSQPVRGLRAVKMMTSQSCHVGREGSTGSLSSESRH